MKTICYVIHEMPEIDTKNNCTLVYLPKNIISFIEDGGKLGVYLINDEIPNEDDSYERIVSDLWTNFEDLDIMLVVISSGHPQLKEIFKLLESSMEFVEIEVCTFLFLKGGIDTERVYLMTFSIDKNGKEIYILESFCEEIEQIAQNN